MCGISHPDDHADKTLDSHLKLGFDLETNQTSNMTARLQETGVQKYVELLRISALTR